VPDRPKVPPRAFVRLLYQPCEVVEQLSLLLDHPHEAINSGNEPTHICAFGRKDSEPNARLEPSQQLQLFRV
jgi:hypothetical protein